MKIRFAVTLLAATGLAAGAMAQPDHPGVYRATPVDPGQQIPINLPGDGPGFDMSWNTIDNSGGPLQGGIFLLEGTVGQPDAGVMSANGYELMGGYWSLTETPTACYANCDGSTANPVLNANDFQCFLTAFAANDPYANCDGSAVPPVLNANDFQCFLNAFATGCP